MFELQSCKIIERETKIDTNFNVNFATYESTFVDENKEEYVYKSELIYVNKVPSLVDCLNDTISVFYNKDALIPVHKRHITFIEICNMIGSRYFDLYINGTFL